MNLPNPYPPTSNHWHRVSTPADPFIAVVSFNIRYESLVAHHAHVIGAIWAEYAAAEILLNAARDALGAFDVAVAGAQGANASTESMAVADTDALARQAKLRTWQALRDAAAERVRGMAMNLQETKVRLTSAQDAYLAALSLMREERDALIQVSRPTPLRPADVHEQAPPGSVSQDEIKAVRTAIERDDWSDLPAFYGSEEPRRRECKFCGGELPESRKRFCSKECRDLFVEAFGTSAFPKRGPE